MTRVAQQQLELVDRLKARKIVRQERVEQVLKSIDRYDFVQTFPYLDNAQPISANADISAPHFHAYILEVLAVRLGKAKRCLDIGCGSGFLTLAFCKLMPTEAVSIGIDGRNGFATMGPFDCIHVGAACEQVPPLLLEQLAPGGLMLIPLLQADGQQYLCALEKAADGLHKFTVKKILRVNLPLIIDPLKPEARYSVHSSQQKTTTGRNGLMSQRSQQTLSRQQRMRVPLINNKKDDHFSSDMQKK